MKECWFPEQYFCQAFLKGNYHWQGNDKYPWRAEPVEVHEAAHMHRQMHFCLWMKKKLNFSWVVQKRRLGAGRHGGGRPLRKVRKTGRDETPCGEARMSVTPLFVRMGVKKQTMHHLRRNEQIVEVNDEGNKNKATVWNLRLVRSSQDGFFFYQKKKKRWFNFFWLFV